MLAVSESESIAARLALAAFGVPADVELQFVKQRENHVYRVRGNEIDRSLRMHRVGYRSDDELRSEAAMMQEFQAGGIAVPAPVAMPSGAMVAVFVDSEGVRRQATMQEWIDEGSDFGDSAAVFSRTARPTDDSLEELGSLIARMHVIAQTGSPDGSLRQAWNAAGLTGASALWGAPGRLRCFDHEGTATIEATERKVAGVLNALQTDLSRYGLIHADFTFENVLTTPDGLVLLDFDDAGSGWYLFDLATPLFWCTRHPEAAVLADALGRGYQRVRALPDDPDAWHALLLARGLTYLGWAADRPGHPVSDYNEDVVAPWVLEAANRYLRTGDTGWHLPLTLHDASATR